MRPALWALVMAPIRIRLAAAFTFASIRRHFSTEISQCSARLPKGWKSPGRSFRCRRATNPNTRKETGRKSRWSFERLPFRHWPLRNETTAQPGNACAALLSPALSYLSGINYNHDLIVELLIDARGECREGTHAKGSCEPGQAGRC